MVLIPFSKYFDFPGSPDHLRRCLLLMANGLWILDNPTDKKNPVDENVNSPTGLVSCVLLFFL